MRTFTFCLSKKETITAKPSHNFPYCLLSINTQLILRLIFHCYFYSNKKQLNKPLNKKIQEWRLKLVSESIYTECTQKPQPFLCAARADAQASDTPL